MVDIEARRAIVTRHIADTFTTGFLLGGSFTSSYFASQIAPKTGDDCEIYTDVDDVLSADPRARACVCVYK